MVCDLSLITVLPDPAFSGQYLTSLLECQHQEKVSFVICLIFHTLLTAVQPSIQKLVGSVVQDALVHLTEESVHTVTFSESTQRLDTVLQSLAEEFSTRLINHSILKRAVDRSPARISQRLQLYQDTVSTWKAYLGMSCSLFSQVAGILEIANRTTTHVRQLLRSS